MRACVCLQTMVLGTKTLGGRRPRLRRMRARVLNSRHLGLVPPSPEPCSGSARKPAADRLDRWGEGGLSASHRDTSKCFRPGPAFPAGPLTSQPTSTRVQPGPCPVRHPHRQHDRPRRLLRESVRNNPVQQQRGSRDDRHESGNGPRDRRDLAGEGHPAPPGFRAPANCKGQGRSRHRSEPVMPFIAPNARDFAGSHQSRPLVQAVLCVSFRTDSETLWGFLLTGETQAAEVAMPPSSWPPAVSALAPDRNGSAAASRTPRSTSPRLPASGPSPVRFPTCR